MRENDFKTILCHNQELPDNVEWAIQEAYDIIFDEEKSKELLRKKNNNRKKSTLFFRTAAIIAACLLCIVGVIFREDIVRAAIKGYNYVYGIGPVEESGENYAYTCEDGFTIGTGSNLLNVKYIYWYENKLYIFGSSTYISNDTNIDDILTVQDGISCKASSINGYGKSLCTEYETPQKANSFLHLTAYGETKDIMLTQQNLYPDDSKIIRTVTDYGEILVYPLNAEKNIYTYTIRLTGKYKDGYASASARAYSNGELLDSKKCFLVDQMIYVEDGYAIDSLTLEHIQVSCFTDYSLDIPVPHNEKIILNHPLKNELFQICLDSIEETKHGYKIIYDNLLNGYSLDFDMDYFDGTKELSPCSSSSGPCENDNRYFHEFADMSSEKKALLGDTMKLNISLVCFSFDDETIDLQP